MLELSHNYIRKEILKPLPSNHKVKCHNCGAFVDISTDFCPVCGNVVSFEKNRKFIERFDQDIRLKDVQFYDDGMYILKFYDGNVNCSMVYNFDGTPVFPVELRQYEKEYFPAHKRFIISKTSQLAKRGDVGLYNSDGKAIISCVCDSLRGINDNGMIICQYKGKWGVLDINNKCHISYDYDACYSISRESDLYAVNYNGLWGVKNLEDIFLISCHYEEIGWLSEGLLPVKLNGLWGYIDMSDNVKIPYAFTNAGSFSQGIAKVSINDTSFYINTSGQVVQNKTEVCPGIFSIKNLNDTQFIRANGQQAFAKRIVNYSAELGVFMFEDREKYGLYNIDGNVVCPALYDDLWIGCKNPYVIARKGDKTGLLDLFGKILIPFEYDKLYETNVKGLFQFSSINNITSGGVSVRIVRYGLINKFGEIIAPAKYETIGEFTNGLAEFGINLCSGDHCSGLIDAYGNTVEFSPLR